jgi:hypothetical protein
VQFDLIGGGGVDHGDRAGIEITAEFDWHGIEWLKVCKAGYEAEYK